MGASPWKRPEQVQQHLALKVTNHTPGQLSNLRGVERKDNPGQPRHSAGLSAAIPVATNDRQDRRPGGQDGAQPQSSALLPRRPVA